MVVGVKLAIDVRVAYHGANTLVQAVEGVCTNAQIRL